MLLLMTVYDSVTGNQVEMLLPRTIIESWFETHIIPELDSNPCLIPVDFENWLVCYDANQVEGLFTFAESK